MAMTCRCCTHRLREKIERALVKGVPLRDIEKRFSVSKASLSRHKLHVAASLAKSTQAAELLHQDRLTAEVRALIADVHRLKGKAERNRDMRSAIAAINTALRGIELVGRLNGQLTERSQNLTLNVELTPEEAVQLAKDCLEIMGDSVPKTLLHRPPQVIDVTQPSDSNSDVSETCVLGTGNDEQQR